MDDELMPYQVIESDRAEDLSLRVSDKLKRGCRLSGGLSVSTIGTVVKYAQAVIFEGGKLS